MNSLHLYVGVDVSKLKHDVAAIDDQKRTVTPCFVVNESAEGYRSLLERLEKIRQRLCAANFHIGMEATGDYWKNLYHFLSSRTEYPVTVINPVQTRHFAMSELRRAKTDPVDAVDIARYMLERKPNPTLPQAIGLELVKDIDKQILSLIKERNANIYRLRLELGKTFPELEQAATSLTAQRLLVLLSNYPTAELIRQTSVEQLCQLTYGKKDRHIAKSFVENVKKLAQDSIACKIGPDAGIIVQTLAQRLREIEQHICWLKTKLVEVFRRQTGQPSILTTIPGIAPLTATILEACIGDVSRFPDYKKIVAYFGMNPTVCKSGKSLNRKSRLQKKGNARVRNILFMNVLTMIKHKVDPIYSFYQRKVDEGKAKLVAVTAAMRKLLVIIYEMLKNNESFQQKK